MIFLCSTSSKQAIQCTDTAVVIPPLTDGHDPLNEARKASVDRSTFVPSSSSEAAAVGIYRSESRELFSI